MQPLQDWLLAIGVGLLVLIDLFILMVYTVVEGLRGNLIATRIPNIERPEETSGVSSKITRVVLNLQLMIVLFDHFM